MKQGELASWVGIVLSGDLVATAPDGRVLAHMGTGTIVGEFSFFAGGRRATAPTRNGNKINTNLYGF